MKTTEILLEQLMVVVELRLEAFEDADGVPTIGYGHTKDVRMGDRISVYWAKELLRDDIEAAEWQVKELGVARNEAQLDALVSLAIDLGIEALKRSTLLQVLREGGTRGQIRKEFKRAGMGKRREWETKRFFE